MLGTSIDMQRKKKSMRNAAKVSRSANVISEDLFNALFDIIYTNLLYTKSIAIISTTDVKNSDGGFMYDIVAHRGETLDKFVSPFFFQLMLSQRFLFLLLFLLLLGKPWMHLQHTIQSNRARKLFR